MNIFKLAEAFRKLAEQEQKMAYEITDENMAAYLGTSIQDIKESKLGLTFCADCGFPLDFEHEFSDCDH
jgi:hypothetical protein